MRDKLREKEREARYLSERGRENIRVRDRLRERERERERILMQSNKTQKLTMLFY
jgi:hypothetical protein